MFTFNQPINLLKTTALVCAMSLAACTQNTTPATDTEVEVEDTTTKPDGAEKPESEIVTIYSSRNEQLIQPLLDQFTEETGIGVELITDKAGPLMARLEAEGANTEADMFLTVDAGNLWQAAEKGLLQPVQSDVLATNVPAAYREPEGKWTGLSLRARTIFYNPNKVNETELSTYEDLADPKWQGRLCLRTSKKVYNQSLVASMIEHLGAEKTEQVIKGWVANLATDVFSNDTKMLEAIAAEQCDVGIANSYYYGRMLDETPDLPVKLFWANQDSSGVHVNVSGAGVVANANNADAALKLIEWLSSDTAQGVYASSDKEYPVKQGIDESEMLASWGEFKADDINVAKFGQLQTEAIQLMDKAGYK